MNGPISHDAKQGDSCNDRALVERFVAYQNRPRRRPLWSFYRLLGYQMPEFMEELKEQGAA